VVLLKVPDTTENIGKCLCPRCPSFPKDCNEESLYCARGMSECEIWAKGCVCPGCPIYSAYNLNEIYFCDKQEVGTTKIMMRKKRTEEPSTFYKKMMDIKEIATTGRSIIGSMGSLKRLPFSLDDLHFIPAQVYRMPLDQEDRVNTEVIVGPRAKRPLKVASPIMISGMSLGSTSRNVKLIISQVAARLRIAYNSGEGGILEEEFQVAPDLIIGQYTTDRTEVDMEILKKVAAVEIRFGQGAYPGKASFLPKAKMSPAISNVRGLKGVEQARSPAYHYDMTTPDKIKEKVSWLREVTGGVPVGAKIGCGNVERDIKILVDSDVDFIALDGFGGGTGGTELYVRENVGIPIMAALPRASMLLKKMGSDDDLTLIAGGGLLTSADFAKCLALGADAVCIATAALIAINCEQYRICHTGLCPTGVTTHSPILTRQLDVQKGIERLANFIRVSTEEIANLARIVGKDDVSKLGVEDLISLSKDLTAVTGTKWLGGN